MKNCSKINLDFLKTDGTLCAKVPYNGLLFNSSQIMTEAGLDNLTLSWPKKDPVPGKGKDLAYDLDFYLSISG